MKMGPKTALWFDSTWQDFKRKSIRKASLKEGREEDVVPNSEGVKQAQSPCSCPKGAGDQ